MAVFDHRRSPGVRLGWVATGLLLLVAGCGGAREEGPASRAPAPPSSRPPGATAPGASRGDAQAGQRVFASSCISCHGSDGRGLPGLGKDLTTSAFVAELTDDELVEFIKVGRDAGDPLNTTGVAMPPKGGNPALTEQDLYDVVAYLRQLQSETRR